MITPKQKAKELFISYFGKIVILDSELSKECAVLAVFHIIETLIEYGKDTHELQNMVRELDFWYKVIEEINLI